jgi:hypothetical protein
MLTAAQQHAVDQFAKSLSALGDDALIDTYHQAWEDHREANAEGSDNLSKAHAKSLAAEKAMRDRFPDYQSRYQLRYPCISLFPVPIVLSAYHVAARSDVD